MKNKFIFVAGLGFILMQVLFFSYLLLIESNTFSLKCTSSFTRNINGEPGLTYTGDMALMLSRSGKGNLFIEGATNEETPRKFHRAYFFNYHIDDDGIFWGKLKANSAGVNNEFSEDDFSKKFFELNFQLRGGLRISTFKNVYILSIPGFIISTCAPA